MSAPELPSSIEARAQPDIDLQVGLAVVAGPDYQDEAVEVLGEHPLGGD